jgi:hypothetical protein
MYKWCKYINEQVFNDVDGCQHGKCSTCFYRLQIEHLAVADMAKKLRKRKYALQSRRYSNEFFYTKNGVKKRVSVEFVKSLYEKEFGKEDKNNET